MPDKNSAAGAGDYCDEETEVIAELKEFCAHALKDGLKIFSLLNYPVNDSFIDGPTEADHVREIMRSLLEYDPDNYDDPFEPIEYDPLTDGTADLISVVQTGEALIGIRDSILRRSQKDFLERTEQLISRATSLIGVYFLDESLRWFYDSLGDFNREADDLTMTLVSSWQEHRHD